MSFVLRDYQEEGTQACVDILTSKKQCRELVVAPTAAGKSIYTAEAVKRCNRPILIIQPNRELLLQNYQKYLAVGGKATICCASLKTKTKDKIDYTELEDGSFVKCREVSKTTFATVGSVIKHIKELKALGVETLLVDEAHLMTQSNKKKNSEGKTVEKPAQIKKLVKAAGIKNICGLTATSLYLKNGSNGARLVMMNRSQWKLFTDIRYITQISYLVENNYWSKLKYKVFNTDKSVLENNSSGSDYTEESIAKYYESNNLEDRVIEEVGNLKKSGRRSIMIFVNTIKEANDLYKKIPNAAIVHSDIDLKTRSYFIKAFKSLEIPVIINVNCLATGFDHPLVDAIIKTRPTQSIGLYYQQIGRGVRIHPEKEDCLIIDFSGNVDKFGKVEELYYENLEGYGWGLFAGDGTLLTDFPLAATVRPTKESILNPPKPKPTQTIIKSTNTDENPIINFGAQFKGRRFWDCARDKKDSKRFFGYITWCLKTHDKDGFTPFTYGNGADVLRESRRYLQQEADNFGTKQKQKSKIVINIPNNLF